jgi:predicted phosphoadenosine phosphosulfate sulfurtransferase
MQESNRRSHDAPREKNEDTKRTTIILEKSEREFIEALIKDGKESGIKPLISKMLDIYKSMMIYDWRFPGEYYCGISRIALVNVELFNILTQQIPKEKWREMGERMGDALKVSIQSTLGIEASEQENWEKIFERLKVQGFGDFYLKDKFLLLKTPFINDWEIWKGIMERLLSVELETRNSAPPLVFEVKKRKPLSI